MHSAPGHDVAQGRHPANENGKVSRCLYWLSDNPSSRYETQSELEIRNQQFYLREPRDGCPLSAESFRLNFSLIEAHALASTNSTKGTRICIQRSFDDIGLSSTAGSFVHKTRSI